MSNRRKGVPYFVPVFIAFLGFAPLLNFASKPGFDTIRTIDLVRLMAAGGCFGAALTAVVMMFVFGNRRSN